jgi:ribosome silencing factor RsfS/YbeB/iojap
VTERTTLADYFLMMTGTSTTHIRALGDEIEFQLKQRGVMPHHVEGITSSWVLLDYGTVVVNISCPKRVRCTPWSDYGETRSRWTSQSDYEGRLTAL